MNVPTVVCQVEIVVAEGVKHLEATLLQRCVMRLVVELEEALVHGAATVSVVDEQVDVRARLELRRFEILADLVLLRRLRRRRRHGPGAGGDEGEDGEEGVDGLLSAAAVECDQRGGEHDTKPDLDDGRGKRRLQRTVEEHADEDGAAQGIDKVADSIEARCFLAKERASPGGGTR